MLLKIWQNFTSLVACLLLNSSKKNMLCKHKNGFFPIGEPILFIKEINQFYFEFKKNNSECNEALSNNA